MVMAYLYHIRRPDMTLEEGYVGVTDVGLDQRFRQHKHNALNGGKLIVHSALRKYQDIEMCLIEEGDLAYCYEREKQLRPNLYMGWNIAEGGNGSKFYCWDKCSEKYRPIWREAGWLYINWKTSDKPRKTRMKDAVDSLLKTCDDIPSDIQQYRTCRLKFESGWIPWEDAGWNNEFNNTNIIDYLQMLYFVENPNHGRLEFEKHQKTTK